MRGKKRKKWKRTKENGRRVRGEVEKALMFADCVGLSAKKESRDYGNLCFKKMEEGKKLILLIMG